MNINRGDVMRKHYFKLSFFLGLSVLFIAGCASTKPRKPDPMMDSQSQVTQLQSQLQAKDQQIQELQYQLQSTQNSIQTTSSNFSSGSGRSSNVRVSGVSVEDVQRALARAGLDPGPVDGRFGKKTKSAIKAFQRRHDLTADGVVGERTWSYLKG